MKSKTNAVNKLSGMGLSVLHSCCFVSAMLLYSLPVVAADSNYDSLVNQARLGNSAPLLSWLEQNRSQLNANRRADWLQVTGWAGDDQQVILIWESLPRTVRAHVPERGVLAVARAYRNLQQWERALALWQEVLRGNPQQQDARAGWIMSLSDAGQKHQAREQADRFVLENGSFLSYQVLIYVIKAQGNGWDELFALTQLQDLNRDAEQSDVNLMLMHAMAAMRISTPALSYGQRLAPDAAVLRKLELDQAAELVRIAHTDSRGEQSRHWVADRALDRYAQLLQRWKGQPDAETDVVHARTDRLGAYQARNRYTDVINEYESLQEQGHVMPGYAQRWAASAYLATRQPDTAYLILSQLFAGTPASKLQPEDSQDLFFAALESERIEASGQIVQEIMADTPYYRYINGSPAPQPNDNWLSGQVLQAQYLQKINRLDAAQSQNLKLSDGGPGNQGLRINFAEILLARGLPRAAERQLKIAEVLEPANLSLERQQAYVAQDLQEWRQFDLLVEDAVQRSADEPATQQLARSHQVENLHEFRFGGSKGISSGNPVSGAQDLDLYSALYGPREYEHWRPFIGFDYSTGNFDEGKGSQRVQALGVEYTRRNNWAELEVSNHRARGGNKTGLRFSYWHDFNDHWRVGTDLERLSRDTPLRAIRSGVTSNQAGGYVRWYENERREYQFSLATSHFSDGNNRLSYGVSGKERLLSRPYLTVDLLPSIAMSSNSEQEGAYYSPERDLHIAPTLFADHVLYRDYDEVWRQQFLLGAGYYWQQDFGGGLSTTAGYGQRYATNQVFDAGAMLIWSKQPYDGKREHDLSLVFDVNYRF
ncbi:MAG: poly-beta-1,6 N-acetyl-D-glucosamine export porin PgaA [Pseudomonas sp.]|nr:poly-beta-1,6 N-acetyl-D-glucosamine export porin PgaA [Pseudomonas sp.]